MITFILNDQFIQTDKPVGMTLLDFIRYDMDLKSTKIGCREGDCGACTVLSGKIEKETLSYESIVSCLTPLGNVSGKHIVTVEGINSDKLTPVQELLVEHNGTQCGFCTPGFVLSLTEFLLSDNKTSIADAIASMDGNICRCTGYKSIERAADELVRLKATAAARPVQWMVENNYLPDYFMDIPAILNIIQSEVQETQTEGRIIGGGTDLMVQQPDEIEQQNLSLFADNDALKTIVINDSYCQLGAAVTATDIMESAELQACFPKLKEHFMLVSSTQIRNMGTLAGNIVNASPIGDLTIFFLALNADLTLNHNGKQRIVPLKEFFLDYKKLKLQKGEYIEQLGFILPNDKTHFNFEKVSKRQFLDIASVNTAISLNVENEFITEAHLSAGGVSPIPLYLNRTSAFLTGKSVSAETLWNANKIAQEEISPIDDIRGSKEYKRLLLRQLIFAHFIELFPNQLSIPDLQLTHE